MCVVCAMITFHFHLQPQYKYELFHIIFTSFHCTGRYELNKLTSLPMCGFIAQLVEHRTGIAEVTGSNPVEDFFQASSLCDDHISLSNTCMLVSTSRASTSSQMLHLPARTETNAAYDYYSTIDRISLV